jgi:hypothetical protein
MPDIENDEGLPWEFSSLRQYLNGAFYATFAVADRSRILEVLLDNKDLSYTSSNGEIYASFGGNDTNDHIFLLSLDEADKYFKDNQDRVSRFTEQTETKFLQLYKTTWDVDLVLNDNAGDWWLRSTGLNRDAATIDPEGNISTDGYPVFDPFIGVRPALYINLG